MRERPKNADDNDREVVLEKAPDGKELIKITIKARVPGGQEGSSSNTSWPVVQDQPVRTVCPRANQRLSSLSARKWVLGSGMCQRFREGLLLRNQLLASF